MTPGTRPSRRTARAAPLPARGRAVALISLTVAIVGSFFQVHWKRHRPGGSRPHCFRVIEHASAVLDETRSRRGQPPGVFWGRNRGLIASAPANDKKSYRQKSYRQNWNATVDEMRPRAIIKATWSAAESRAAA